MNTGLIDVLKNLNSIILLRLDTYLPLYKFSRTFYYYDITVALQFYKSFATII